MDSANYDDSFMFGNTNMRERFGLKMTQYDILLPPLRPRKVTIPKRSGAYDFGAKYYDERQIRIQLDTFEKSLSREDVREMSYILSKKNSIRFWDEPTKYYIGRLYDASELINYGEKVGYGTEITFICDPFAYGETKQVAVALPVYKLEYVGTAPTPTRISIKNTGTEPVNGIQIYVRERRDTY